MTGDLARKKWGNIRDAYSSSKRKAASKSGDAKKYIKKYKFEDILSFLKPFIQHRETSSNLNSPSELLVLSKSNTSISDEDIPDLPHTSTQKPTPKKRKLPDDSDSVDIDKSIWKYLEDQKENKKDNIHCFFFVNGRNFKKTA
ncbi:uncharacterized protein [Antedon mediterranea]|uniref:uncharacterized protein n=1 Tax=Antedon mediterranea TaxID=105859 RepID=UPI003AF44571